MISTIIYKFSLLLFGFGLFLLGQLLYHTLSTKHAFRSVPGPRPSSWIWGEEWNLYNDLPGKPYEDWHRHFGKVVAFSGAFGHKILSITDRRAIAFILGEAAYSFPKPTGVRAWFKALLGEGILWVEGKKAHETQRRLLAPALNLQSVRLLTHVFFETSIRLANKWAKLVDENHDQKTEIEVTDWTGRFALDTVGIAAFSYDFECLSGEPHQLAISLDGLTNNEHKLSSFYMRALFWIFPAIVKLGKKGEMVREVKHQLGNIALKMWQDAQVAGEKGDRSLMATMLKTTESSSSPIREEEIVAQMRTVISAGYETVSAVAAWMLYELATHPKVQDALREEICAIPDHSFDDLNNHLPLLDAILKETLRLHPAILENHHEASETIIVPLSSPLLNGETQLVIPKGTLVAIPLNVLHTEEEIWGDDAKEFRPSRWLDDNVTRDMKAKRAGPIKDYELLAFSAGPRSCIGKTFAITEIKCLMVTVLQRFSFRCEREIEPFQSFVVRPRVVGETASSLPLIVTKL
ncbi:cytochrome P450 [Crepidotus variabilis]|uniref:Cytochrome P450 n=1 Tax=Crepidotus variabilis TaxID=179855 RepID=A0A9P6E6V3_9AGAR|nr:cytochrome P450 [Crepidotus variabilis]